MEISDKRTDQEKRIVNSNGPSQAGACCAQGATQRTE